MQISLTQAAIFFCLHREGCLDLMKIVSSTLRWNWECNQCNTEETFAWYYLAGATQKADPAATEFCELLLSWPLLVNTGACYEILLFKSYPYLYNKRCSGKRIKITELVLKIGKLCKKIPHSHQYRSVLRRHFSGPKWTKLSKIC